MQECDHIVLNSRMWDQLQTLQVPFDHNLLMTSERNSPAQRRLVVTVLRLTAYVYKWVYKVFRVFFKAGPALCQILD